MGTHPPTKKVAAQPLPQFSAHVCCAQTDGWIKIPLGREVDVVPGDIVLDGDPAAPPQKREAESPKFVLSLLVYSSSSSTAQCILFLEKSLIVLSLFQYKYSIEYLLCADHL